MRPQWVKLRNTQHEQMSSALPPRTDVSLVRPKALRGSRLVKKVCRLLGKRPPKFRCRFDKNGHRVLVGLSAEQALESERTRRTCSLGRKRSS